MRAYLTALLFFSATQVVQATPVSYSFTADGHSGSFTYDDNEVSFPSSMTSGFDSVDYTAISFIVDGQSIDSPVLRLFLDFAGGQYLAFLSDTENPPLIQLGRSGLGLFSADATAAQFNHLSLADFDGGLVPGSINYLFVDDQFFEVLSFALVVAAVPEPALWTLLGLGALGMAMGRRRRS